MNDAVGMEMSNGETNLQNDLFRSLFGDDKIPDAEVVKEIFSFQVLENNLISIKGFEDIHQLDDVRVVFAKFQGFNFSQ